MTAPWNWLNRGDPNAGQGMPYGRPPYVPQKVSILDRLAARLFPAPQGLDPSVSQGVGRQGLLNIGTNLLQAGGPQAQQQGTLANIGAAIGGVDIQGLTQQALKMQAYQQQRQVEQRVQQVAQGTRGIKDPYQRVAAMVTELAGEPGTEDLVGKLSNVLAQLKPERSRGRTIHAGVGASGKPELFLIDPDTGEKQPLGLGAILPSGMTQPSEGERRAGALFTVGEDAYNQLQNAEAPSLTDVLAAKVPGGLGQGAVSARQQIQNQAGAQLYRSYLYIVSGATVNPNEAEETAKTFVPQLGDDPATIARKKQARETMIQAMRQAMGRGQGGSPAPRSAGGPQRQYRATNPIPP